MMLNRRGLLTGLAVALAAPAIIRTPGLLMPVRPVLVTPQEAYNEWAGKRLLIVSTNEKTASKSTMADLFARYVSAAGGVVERRIIGPTPIPAGAIVERIWMDDLAEISNETWHSISTRDRTDVTDRAQVTVDFGSLLTRPRVS